MTREREGGLGRIGSGVFWGVRNSESGDRGRAADVGVASYLGRVIRKVVNAMRFFSFTNFYFNM